MRPQTFSKPLAATLLLIALGSAPLAHAGVISSSPNTLPSGSFYTSPPPWTNYFRVNDQYYIISDDIIWPPDDPVQIFPPTPPGGNSTNTVPVTMTGWLSQDGGATFQAFAAPGSLTLWLASGVDSGNTRNFATTVLDFGASLPGGVLFGDASPGALGGNTSITDLGDGQYQIDSFFDIWPEISFDDGLTWISGDSEGRMTLVPEPSSLSLVGLGLAALVLRNRKARR